MTAPDTIHQLVDRFEENLTFYRSPNYNETQVRQDFIDPFFKALGWDISNEQGLAQNYRDVILEYSQEIQGTYKNPDYAFRIGKEVKFFVEAKKPAINLEMDIHPAFQVRIYAWNAKLAISILTDFDELAVYDCRIRPNKMDKASVGRVQLYSYRDYVEKWDEIAAVFSKEAILHGSFDKYAEKVKGKRRTVEVDDAFLVEIERWRISLAKNIALRNPKLSVRELNYAVQMTIDRIIFLRICEDRGIEPSEQLLRISEHGEIYQELKRLFQLADARYNSGLFHFKDEEGRSSESDTLTLGLTIDEKPLQDILKDLCAPDCPYVFSVIPTEILGQVYEQFLGKVIRLTAGHQAKVEEKPEIRKAGGVYYTPTYVVDYIVNNTLGKMLEANTPADIARLKVLDPACGSGSFLLGAFQCLLDWHLKWYSEHEPLKWAAGNAPAIFQSRNGWLLTTTKKKEILLNNIHGVDIDAQAVEVTKLSLLLKVLEGENQETIGTQLRLFKERVLPDLGNNIKCGNSLIGSDYWEGRMMVDEDERQRVNAFNWKVAFPEVFIQGGFDVVIGNPPYVRIQTLATHDIAYLSQNYETTIGNYDIYCPFLEKAVKLVSSRGLVGFILPHRFFKTDYGDGLRTFLSSRQLIDQIVDFDGYMVFRDASINTCVIILSNLNKNNYKFSQVRFVRHSESEMPEIMKRITEADNVINNNFISGNLPLDLLGGHPWIFIFPWEQSLWNKIAEVRNNLGNISSQIFQGLKTGGDSVYSIHEIKKIGRRSLIANDMDNKEYLVENDLLYPQVKGGEMQRYLVGETNRAVIFPYENGQLINAGIMESRYPLTWKYLQGYEKFLRDREGGKMKGVSWFGYTRSQALSSMRQPKILTPDYYAHPSYCFDTDGHYFFFGGGAGGYGIVLKSNWNPAFVLGLLNSRLLGWYVSKISVRQYQTAYSYVKKYIEQIPIKELNLLIPADKAQYDKMVSMVEHMLELHKSTPRTPQEKEMVKREIETTDQEIDKLVYELYELTDEEIKIVESK